MNTTDTKDKTPRPPRAAIGAAALAGGLLAAASAYAAATDAVLMDPSIGTQNISFSSASNPALTTLPVVFTPNTRDAYTKSQPLALPCDVDFLAVGVSFKNISAQPLYIEWSGAVFENGYEKTRIPDAFGRTIVHVADGRLFQPGEVGTGGFIFIAQAPLLSWPASSFPANVPLRLQMESRGFTSPDLDPARGGYSLANLATEDVIWNNNYRIWVKRTCP
jgi:hypothetical protein